MIISCFNKLGGYKFNIDIPAEQIIKKSVLKKLVKSVNKKVAFVVIGEEKIKL